MEMLKGASIENLHKAEKFVFIWLQYHFVTGMWYAWDGSSVMFSMEAFCHEWVYRDDDYKMAIYPHLIHCI